MRRYLRVTGGIFWLVLLAGCNSPAGMAWRERIEFPRLFHPGSAEYQRARVMQYDPYLLPEQGPRVPSARPPDFQNPSAEPTRARSMPYGGY